MKLIDWIAIIAVVLVGWWFLSSHSSASTTANVTAYPFPPGGTYYYGPTGLVSWQRQPPSRPWGGPAPAIGAPWQG